MSIGVITGCGVRAFGVFGFGCRIDARIVLLATKHQIQECDTDKGRLGGCCFSTGQAFLQSSIRVEGLGFKFSGQAYKFGS